MQWILVVYAYSCLNSGGIDPGIIPGNCGMRGRTEITMSSQEVCVQIRDANKFANAECWAKVDAPQPALRGSLTIIPNLALPNN